MPRATRLSNQEQAQVRALFEAGWSRRRIAAHIGRSRNCINEYLRNPDQYGKKNSPGRPRLLSAQDERTIGRVLSNSTKSLNRLRAEMRLLVSKTTVWRVIQRSESITREMMRRVPRLSERHKVARLQFAMKNASFDWTKVIWSDEKKFNLDGPDSRRGYWRDLRKAPLVLKRRNFGGGSLMVWGAFCAAGQLELAFVSCRMDSVEYQRVLEERLLPFLRQHRRRSLIFMHDNAAVHVSRSTLDWIASRNITVLEWPACSQDLNPMENVWAFIVKKIYDEAKQYNTVEELKLSVLDAWTNLDPNLIASLVDSMPRRIGEVLANNGEPTHY
uniref:DDE_3 domain-containing protein n=1 Tax=Haemonchus contortus TaxID=6289 RepID=A0A7I4YE78_HAECO